MRLPPRNPFKEEVEEPEVVEAALPELPKLMVMTKPSEPDVPKLEVKGNGHNPDADEQELKDKADKEEDEARQKDEDKELERMREEAEEAKIPGSGYLFNVKKKHLPEATRLNEREIFTFAVGAVQDYVLQRNDDKVVESVFEKFSNSIFRLKISAGGKGREENIAVRQVDAEEKANSARGSMNGI